MTKQYAIVNIIGSGTEDDMFRADVTCDHAVIIPTGPDGKPTSTWGLLRAEDTALAQERCTRIPLGKLRDTPPQERGVLMAELARKINVQDLALDDGWDKVVTRLEQALR